MLRIRTTGCMRTRQSSYEIVGDCSVKGGQRYQPLDCFILWEVLARRRVMFMFRVMTHIFSYKLFLNWIGAVRFQVVSHEVYFDKGFVIWHFLYYYFLQIVSVWSMSIWIRVIFNSYELVNQTRNWNQPQTRFSYEKKCAAGKIFLQKECDADKTYTRKCAEGKIILTEFFVTDVAFITS